MPTEERKETDDVAGPAKAALSGTSGPAPGGSSGPLPRSDADATEAQDAPDTEDVPLDPADATQREEVEPDPDTLVDPPGAVAELAAACVRFVATRYGIHLDFNPDTLSLVDQWLRDARSEMATRPQLVELVQGAAGAYFGEVVRRAFGGTWLTDGEQPGWRLLLSRVYCAFNPIGMAREALLLGEAEGWHAHFELDPGDREEIDARLGALPAVGEDEYYAPSTRFDVVNIVVDALREKMRASGLGDVTFGPDDYDSI